MASFFSLSLIRYNKIELLHLYSNPYTKFENFTVQMDFPDSFDFNLLIVVRTILPMEIFFFKLTTLLNKEFNLNQSFFYCFGLILIRFNRSVHRMKKLLDEIRLIFCPSYQYLISDLKSNDKFYYHFSTTQNLVIILSREKELFYSLVL